MLDWLELPGDAARETELTEDVRPGQPAERRVAVGERLYYQGEFARAAAEFARARQHDPLLFEAWAAECEALVRAGDLAAADAAATRALQSYGQVPVFYAARAIVLAHQGRIRTAYEHSDVAVREHESGLLTWLGRAEVILAADRKGPMGSVEACFAKALEVAATPWQVGFRSGLILRDWGHAAAALDRLSHTAAALPANPFLWKLRGDCRRLLGQPAAARQCYQRALAVRAGYRPAIDALRALSGWGRLRARIRRLFGGREEP